mmetsp:Transcript_35018/g.98755  ORF Transcript_35018/g.98755 Transcript_35018/m.98755 type:complete len:86 (+) Transcript_35018:24-281(+)
MNTGGDYKRRHAIPPEKGSFPLDHYADCKQAMEGYSKCMAENGSHASHCKVQLKQYLQCRMNKDLMAKEDLREFGLSDDDTQRQQ